jgi:hypothetical protein
MTSPNDPGVSAEKNALRVANNVVNRIGVPPAGERIANLWSSMRKEGASFTLSSVRREPKTGRMTWN